MQLTSFDDINRKHRHIFLSPHLDDVVYSCGGTLGVQVSCGLQPLVITVFAGIPSPALTLSPFATQIERGMQWKPAPGVTSLVEARRKEDATALDLLQADYLWLDYLDAIYRGNPAYYTRNEQLIGGNVHLQDMWIEKELAENLLALQRRLPDAVWYAPLAIGRHVDHQIVCSAADQLAQRGAKVNFYEDFPYVLREGSRETRLKELGGQLEPGLVEMSEMLPLRIEASERYASQISINFDSKEAMHEAMKKYTHGIRPVETVYLEEYWTNR
ncbi:MAG: PIG-L family deacetylase [Chloroflexi bacterium]|nr:MAG: PIG-L family deacetylase [Chloroflexota bacterium]